MNRKLTMRLFAALCCLTLFHFSGLAQSAPVNVANGQIFCLDVVGQISNGPWTGLTYGGQSLAVDN